MFNGLQRGAWMLRRVEVNKWGLEVIIHGTFHPEADYNTDFQLLFNHCHYLNWEVIEPEFQELDGHDVIGMDFHESSDEKRLVINAHEFELTITYGELIIHKDW